MSTEKTRWEQKLESYTKALTRLVKVVNESKKRQLNEFELDCIVQRFEFTHEVAWKLIKSYAEYQGDNEIAGSRDATRWAFENHLVLDGQVWMNMIRSRNDTSHQYDGVIAEQTISQIVDNYCPAMIALHERMTAISENTPNDLFTQE